MRKILFLVVTLLSLSAQAGDGGAPAKKSDGAKASITCGQLRNLCSGLCHSDTTCFSQCMAGHGC